MKAKRERKGVFVCVCESLGFRTLNYIVRLPFSLLAIYVFLVEQWLLKATVSHLPNLADFSGIGTCVCVHTCPHTHGCLVTSINKFREGPDWTIHSWPFAFAVGVRCDNGWGQGHMPYFVTLCCLELGHWYLTASVWPVETQWAILPAKWRWWADKNLRSPPYLSARILHVVDAW